MALDDRPQFIHTHEDHRVLSRPDDSAWRSSPAGQPRVTHPCRASPETRRGLLKTRGGRAPVAQGRARDPAERPRTRQQSPGRRTRCSRTATIAPLTPASRRAPRTSPGSDPTGSPARRTWPARRAANARALGTRSNSPSPSDERGSEEGPCRRARGMRRRGTSRPWRRKRICRDARKRRIACAPGAVDRIANAKVRVVLRQRSGQWELSDGEARESRIDAHRSCVADRLQSRPPLARLRIRSVCWHARRWLVRTGSKPSSRRRCSSRGLSTRRRLRCGSPRDRRGSWARAKYQLLGLCPTR